METQTVKALMERENKIPTSKIKMPMDWKELRMTKEKLKPIDGRNQ